MTVHAIEMKKENMITIWSQQPLKLTIVINAMTLFLNDSDAKESWERLRHWLYNVIGGTVL